MTLCDGSESCCAGVTVLVQEARCAQVSIALSYLFVSQLVVLLSIMFARNEESLFESEMESQPMDAKVHYVIF
jgi:hypothetical protein